MGMNLNKEQREAIEYLGGPLLVLAGAGSGKTRVITEKIAHLVMDEGYPPSSVVAITFTKKAAKEMKERLERRLPTWKAKGVLVSTFHSLGKRIVSEEAHLINYKKGFTIIDSHQKINILKDIVDTRDKEEILRIESMISAWKNDLVEADKSMGGCKDDFERKASNCYRKYQRKLEAYNALDYDDLLLAPCVIFRKNPECAMKWRTRIRHLLVDECQDTNKAQFELLRHLVGERASFTAVGDDDQSIYAWRGADSRNLERLQVDFPALRVVKLEQNYRSTSRILRAANALIRNNSKVYEKNLWSALGEGRMIRVVACDDERHEAETVVEDIAATVNSGERTWGDHAILYRGNHQSKNFESLLRIHQIPYTVTGGESFFEKEEIKDIVAHIRLATKPEDDGAFLRSAISPKKGITHQSIEILNSLVRGTGRSMFELSGSPEFLMELGESQRERVGEFRRFIIKYARLADLAKPREFVEEMVFEIGYEAYLLQKEDERVAAARWNNVLEFLSWIKRNEEEYGKSLREVAKSLLLKGLLSEKKAEAEEDAVRLMTLHASKGLEFPCAHIVSCEEGVFPNPENDRGDTDIEEERRLMYVGITRAKEDLSISWCRLRKKGGAVVRSSPSRFIGELPEEEIEKVDAGKAWREERDRMIEMMKERAKRIGQGR